MNKFTSLFVTSIIFLVLFPSVYPDSSINDLLGKMRVEDPVNNELFNIINRNYGNDSTCFRLIHAGKSIILIPVQSAFELVIQLGLFQDLGILNGKLPDFQIAMGGGRWGNRSASIVGASLLLATETNTNYKEGAFSTTHDRITGARIMAYDEGVKKLGLPFDFSGLLGRTDMLGRNNVSDCYIFQILGTLATHGKNRGIFAGIWNEYGQNFMSVLEKYGLLGALNKSAWVYGNSIDENDTQENHESMIRKFTDVYAASMDLPGFGIIAETRRLITGAREEMIAVSKKNYPSSHSEVTKLRNY